MEYQNRQIASDVYMGAPDNEYKVSSERYLLDFKNIEAEDVVSIFLNMISFAVFLVIFVHQNLDFLIWELNI